MPSKKKESPFKEILSQVKSTESSTPKQATQIKESQKTAPKQRAAKPAVSKSASTPPPSGKRGKSSDPDYTQATLYIRKDTHHQIKMKLLAERQERDMSDLAEELFTRWLQSNI